MTHIQPGKIKEICKVCKLFKGGGEEEGKNK